MSYRKDKPFPIRKRANGISTWDKFLKEKRERVERDFKRWKKTEPHTSYVVIYHSEGKKYGVLGVFKEKTEAIERALTHNNNETMLVNFGSARILEVFPYFPRQFKDEEIEIDNEMGEVSHWEGATFSFYPVRLPRTGTERKVKTETTRLGKTFEIEKEETFE